MLKRCYYTLRNFVRKIRSFVYRCIIGLHLYKTEPLTEIDENWLYKKWKYINPKCVSKDYKFNHPISVDLSIIIPLYNSKEYIHRLIAMLEKQKTEFTYEVLLIDDGSKDDTEIITKNLIVGKHVFRYLREENRGISKARNLGIEASRGEYLAFIDHDDEISELYVEKLVSAAKKNNAQIAICSYAIKYGKTTVNLGLAEGYVWGGIFSRELFDHVRFPEGYWYEDMINNFLLTPQASSIIRIPEILYYKNSTNRNASKKLWTDSNYKSLEDIYLLMSLVDDYYSLGLISRKYLFERILIESSQLAYDRIKYLDTATRKQAFLKCCQLLNDADDSNYTENICYKSKVFYRALKTKDFKLWSLASKLY